MLSKKGVILVMSVGIMAIVAILVMAILLLKISELNTLKKKMDEVRALYVANSGLENLIYYLRIYKVPVWEWGELDANFGNIRSTHTFDTGYKCIGTRIKENYRNNIRWQERIISPEISIPSSPPGAVYLEFRQYIYTYNTGDPAATRIDGGWVELSSDNGLTWGKIFATGAGAADNYNATCTEVAGFACYGGASGPTTGWTGLATLDLPIFNLTQYGVAGRKIRLAFCFYSDGDINYPGWYIDNVRVYAGGTNYLNENFESGAENWTLKIKPLAFTQAGNNLIPNDFPAGSGYLNYVSIDNTYAYEDTYILKSIGIIDNYKRAYEAKVTISGESSPYNIVVHWWKPTF